jgi:hypothetical protein
MDAITAAIAGLTNRVIAYRIYQFGGLEMARLIEIKGIGADVASIKKGIGELRAVASEVNTESTALKAELGDLRDQIKEHRADLRFEAETLGNGGEPLEPEPEKPSPPPPQPEQTATPQAPAGNPRETNFSR